MVDMDAAIGYVVAHGDPVERARLSWLRAGAHPPEAVLQRMESGQTEAGGWPAAGDGSVPSIDATCFRLAELDDLGGLQGPPVEKALAWLASVQREDGTWQEDESLADVAPVWAVPGDPEATFYQTAVAGFWLTVADVEEHPHHEAPPRYAKELGAAARFVVSQLRSDNTWPSFLAAGWHAAGLLHEQQFFYESARVQLVLGDRLGDMSPADLAGMAAALRRVNLGDDWLLRSARKRLAETQRTDGGWDSDEGPIFDVNTTLTAIRACR
ncbi:prenyltransferase/squalene oxidase repeat-containing protein [Symbioplanes lichenis]|uniref:prenyltransferase/squalene oxidase repeat-containing protein n=1 Tax=Symbioplanes lichenis TaxID=1629072 RepID=UPI002738DD55|nr:prenyltransferase/squalene oxidase repeat-containing protein [Actinoplanes lichenis]